MVLSCCFNSYFEYQFLWNLLSNIVLGNFQYKWLCVAHAFRVLTESLCLVEAISPCLNNTLRLALHFVDKNLMVKNTNTNICFIYVVEYESIFLSFELKKGHPLLLKLLHIYTKA